MARPTEPEAASSQRPTGDPATGEEPDTPPRSRRRTWLVRAAYVLLVVIVLGIAGIVAAFALIRVPDPNELAAAQTSIVYYDDGTTELARVGELDRESVPLDQVPQHVRQAVIAAEDRSFYENSGISLTGIGRSVWQAVTGADTQGGGSTITQQYVKNYFLTSDRTPSRKLREMVISIKVDQQHSKDEILQDYLNTIYYGRGAYGIQAAARAYFGTDVSQLTVAQGAVLASVVNAPSLFDPALGEKQQQNLQSRFDYVLDGMVSQGWLSQQERDATSMPQISPSTTRTLGGPTGYLVAAVRAELKGTVGLSDQDIDRGGLRIRTTLNKKAEDAALAAVADNMPSTGKTDGLEAGLVAVRPGDGAVVAMYGGADYEKRQLSSATDARLPGGSTFKPFALVAALEQDVSTKTTVSGSSPLIDRSLGIERIENEGGVSYGTVDLRTATAKSINTAFVRLNEQIGPATTKEAAIAAGIPADTPGLGDEITNVLGNASPHVIDLAGAYATIAANGQRATPYLISSVGSDVVDISYQAEPSTETAFSEDVAADVIDAMTQVTRSGGTGARAASLNRPVAGKTGTSEERKSVWFGGFTPQLAVAVGMYRDVNGVPQPLVDIGGRSVVTGNSFPLSIWIDFMDTALDGEPKLDFPKRVGIGDNRVTPTRTTRPSPSTTTTATPSPSTTSPTTTATPSTTTTTPRPTSRTTSPSTTTTPATTTTTTARNQANRTPATANQGPANQGPANRGPANRVPVSSGPP